MMSIKGYHTAIGFMGYVNGKYILFATEEEYVSYIREIEMEDSNEQN